MESEQAQSSTQNADHTRADSATLPVCEPAMRRYISVDEFCVSTGLSRSTVRRRIADGSIPFHQPGGRRSRILIPATALDEPSQRPKKTLLSMQSSSRKAPEQLSGPKPRWQIQTSQEHEHAQKTHA